jgi:hypothetical protein
MERLIECLVLGSGMIVPALSIWAIACLYISKNGCQCRLANLVYFGVLLMVAGLTVRTVLVDDSCWLIHTATLGMLVVFGVMRRPNEEIVEFDLQLR